MKKNKEKEILEFQIYRLVTILYKDFLDKVEGLSEEHKNQFDKLKKSIPEKENLIEQAEFLDKSQLNYLRKKILDNGNDCRRELILMLENFEINFKK
tara:strand:- start:283 stop:573 length:291 start_codon:yes stop_codon:yes gene_type:complete